MQQNIFSTDPSLPSAREEKNRVVGGTLYLVFRPDRLESLFAALRAAKFAPKRMLFVQDAPTKAPGMVLCEARLGGNEGLVLLPTLVLRERSENGAPLTPAAERIYQTGYID